jgi:hypothetical protein
MCSADIIINHEQGDDTQRSYAMVLNYRACIHARPDWNHSTTGLLIETVPNMSSDIASSQDLDSSDSKFMG